MEAPSRLPAVAPEVMHAAPCHGRCTTAIPGYFTPMLSVSAESPPVGPDWLYESSGTACVCSRFIDSGNSPCVRARAWRSRKRIRTSRSCPSRGRGRVGDTRRRDRRLDAAGRPSFQLLQPRIMATPANAVTYARTRPANYFVFDLPYLMGGTCALALVRAAAITRIDSEGQSGREVLAEFIVPPRELLAAVKAQGLEGLSANAAQPVRIDAQ